MLCPKSMRVLQFVQPLCNKMTFNVINGIIYYLNGINLCFLTKKTPQERCFQKLTNLTFFK